MAGYDVSIDLLRAGGLDAVSAGEDTRAARLPTAVSGLEAALPDTASAAAARKLCTAWQDRMKALGDDIVRLGTDLGDTADQYTNNEVAAESELTHLRRAG